MAFLYSGLVFVNVSLFNNTRPGSFVKVASKINGAGQTQFELSLLLPCGGRP